MMLGMACLWKRVEVAGRVGRGQFEVTWFTVERCELLRYVTFKVRCGG